MLTTTPRMCDKEQREEIQVKCTQQTRAFKYTRLSEKSPMDSRRIQGQRTDITSAISTLVLIQDAEYDLHASCGTLTFSQWGIVEASGKKRVASVSLSLIARHAEEDTSRVVAAVPLVITAPFTPRFQLNTAGNSSLTPMLREKTPLEFSVEFVAPTDEKDEDSCWANFQDQVIIQTRLARLTIRLCAMRENGEEDRCETFIPLTLPTVRAPSFKLFDQIERDAGSAMAASQPSATRRATASGSFNPQKNVEYRLESLTPLPLRQPTPPQQEGGCSRSSSSLSGRHTASPRILDPLPSTPPAPQLNVNADVINQVEAAEVIRRLRARRTSLQPTAAISSMEMKAVAPPECPESRLDAQAKSELEEFNLLIKTAKRHVACEVDKAKQELDYYKSLLPKHVPVETTAAAPQSLPSPDITVASVQMGVAKKPVRLSVLLPMEDVAKSRSIEPIAGPMKNNQELSPVKLSKPNVAPRQSKVHKAKPLESPEQHIYQPQHEPQRATRTVSKTLSVRKTASLLRPTRAPTENTGSKRGKATKSVKSTITKQPIVNRDDELLDFDDSDPEVDDAPVMPDDLRGRCGQEQEEEDEDMMRMLAR